MVSRKGFCESFLVVGRLVGRALYVLSKEVGLAVGSVGVTVAAG